MSLLDIVIYMIQILTDPFGIFWYIVGHMSATLTFWLSLPNDLLSSIITNFGNVLDTAGYVISSVFGIFIYAEWLVIIGFQVLIIVAFAILGALKRIPGL